MPSKIGAVLVVGAGISGIRSGLHLAELGYRVTLIDKAPAFGGVLSQLDQQFPNNHCGMCRLLPQVERDGAAEECLRRGLFHPNLDLRLATELLALEGEAGRFKATIRQQPPLVDRERCTGCGDCASVCPVEVEDQFNAGHSRRRAIYLPVPHRVPKSYVVDLDCCTLCGECQRVCPTGAIDLGLDARARFRILVVDDEFIIRDSLREWLEAEGFRVRVAASGSEALEMSEEEDYGLILLDVKMPGMDGMEVLRRLQEREQPPPVVMMTAYATVETAVEAMKIGALDYLVKPFEPEVLIPLVVRIYQRLQQRQQEEIEVGAVILAPGTAPYDPFGDANGRYQDRHPNVVTALEFERLLSGTGPGLLRRPADGGRVRRIAWLQCVGSRERQGQGDYCAAVCCMHSLKEAMLAKQLGSGEMETTIFYMDMRTYGKKYQRYRHRAAMEAGVRLVRSRVHSLIPEPQTGRLWVTYIDIQGRQQAELFDLVVLASGRRPQVDLAALAAAAGVELDSRGFLQSSGLLATRTTRPGVFTAGTGPRDIADSVLLAGSAAMAASLLLHRSGLGLALEAAGGDAALELGSQVPRIMVALCTCGGKLEEQLDLAGLEEALAGRRAVAAVLRLRELCSPEGWEDLCRRGCEDPSINRVLIGACAPQLTGAHRQRLALGLGLPAHLIETVDIHAGARDVATGRGFADGSRRVRHAMAMAAARLVETDPEPAPVITARQRVLVVGGGPAGLSATLALAEHGIPVVLVEKEAELGGNLRWLGQDLEGRSFAALAAELLHRVERHPLVEVHPNCGIVHSQGHAGGFETTLESGDGSREKVEHGAVILATGGGEAAVTGHGYGSSNKVLTQAEVEMRLRRGELRAEDLGVVAMIQCVGSREEPRNYCSRICCPTALKHALWLKEKNSAVEIYVFYRDLMSPGFLETYYTKAREAGVVFIPYELAHKPQVDLEADGQIELRGYEPILQRELLLRPDLLILSPGVAPNPNAELAAIFGVSVDQDGFLQEADSKWRPVDLGREGVFVAGLANSPRTVAEAMMMGESAAIRALRLVARRQVAAGSNVAVVRHSLCSRCQRCVDACPYGARWLDEEEERIVVDVLACQGCGSCATACLNKAAVVRSHGPRQMLAVIEAALED